MQLTYQRSQPSEEDASTNTYRNRQQVRQPNQPTQSVINNHLPTFEEQPIDFPCQDEQNTIEALERQLIREERRLDRMRLDYDRETMKRQQLTQQNAIQLSRVAICESKTSKLISQLEQASNFRPTCPARTINLFPSREVCEQRYPPISTPTRPPTTTLPTTRRTSTRSTCPTCPSPTCPTCPICPRIPRTTLPTCPTQPPCPVCSTTTPTKCPTCPTSATTTINRCPTTFPPPLPTTTRTTRTIRNLESAGIRTMGWTSSSSITSSSTTTEKPHFNLYNLRNGDWYSDVNPKAMYFSKEGQLAGDVDYVHLIHDINLHELMEKGKQICGLVVEKQLKELMNKNLTDKKVYKVLYETFDHRCHEIVKSLQDSYDTFVGGSHAYMYHTYSRSETTSMHGHTSPGHERDKRQLLIIGAILLAAGVIGYGGYLMGQKAVASMSINAQTNPATIISLKKHEKRLNIDEQDIQKLKDVVSQLAAAEEQSHKDILELQLLHKVENILTKLHWEYFTLTLGLEKLRNGQLSSYLIKPKALQESIRKFRQNLKIIDIHTILTDINEVYKCDTSYLVFKNATIRSVTHIPIYKPDSLMTIFKFHPLPLKIHDHLMTFDPSVTYLAVSKNNSVYRPLTNVDLANCRTIHHLKFCKDGNFFYKSGHNSCIRSLYQGHEQDILNYCPVKFGPETNAMIRLNNEKVVIYHKEVENIQISCSMGNPASDSISFQGFKQFTIFPGCRLQSQHFVLDGVTNTYSIPQDIHVQLPDFNRLEDFKSLQSHLNISLDELNSITSQQSLHINDIDALFKKYEQSNVITLTLLGAIFGTIGILLSCFCFFKCCLPCYRNLRDTFQSPPVPPRSRPPEPGAEENIEMQSTSHWRRAPPKPSKRNLLYPGN